jgi:chaperonin cofactor prefoldin
MVIIKHVNEYLADQLSERVSTLQNALNQAEKIIRILEEENERLKDLLIILSSDNHSSYIIDSEAFDTQLC